MKGSQNVGPVRKTARGRSLGTFGSRRTSERRNVPEIDGHEGLLAAGGEIDFSWGRGPSCGGGDPGAKSYVHA